MKNKLSSQIKSFICLLISASAFSLIGFGCSRESAEERHARAITLEKRGDRLEDAGDKAGALELFLEAERLCPNDPNLLLQSRIASNAAALGKAKEALQALERHVRLNPQAKTNTNVVALQEKLLVAVKTGGNSPVIINEEPTTPHSSKSDGSAPVDISASSAAVVALEARINRLEKLLESASRSGSVQPADSITAKELNITDESGRICLVLGSNERGGVVKCCDKSGNVVAELGGAPSGGYFSLSSKQTESVVYTGINNDGAGFLTTRNASGKSQVSIGTLVGGGGIIDIHNKVDQTVITLQTNEREGGLVKVKNASGQTVVLSGENQFGDGISQVNDKHGRRLMFIGKTDVDSRGVVWSADTPDSDKGISTPVRKAVQ
jgi:hypothetical protein